MAPTIRRRTLLRAALAGTAAGGVATTTGCAPAVKFAWPVLTLLIGTAVPAFAAKVGEKAADGVPNFFNTAWDKAEEAMGGADRGVVTGGYVHQQVPNTQLRSVIGTVFRDSSDDKDDVRSTTVHDINGLHTIKIPSILQLGLNLLLLHEAGFRGNLLAPAKDFTAEPLAGLRPHYSVYSYSRLEGPEEEFLNHHSVYQAVTLHDEMVRVTWDPSGADPTVHSRLVLHKGTVVQGLAPAWRLSFELPVPYRYVFAQRKPK